jgi:hypothetical protein
MELYILNSAFVEENGKKFLIMYTITREHKIVNIKTDDSCSKLSTYFGWITVSNQALTVNDNPYACPKPVYVNPENISILENQAVTVTIDSFDIESFALGEIEQDIQCETEIPNIEFDTEENEMYFDAPYVATRLTELTEA